jgi:hypothetical protein
VFGEASRIIINVVCRMALLNQEIMLCNQLIKFKCGTHLKIMNKYCWDCKNQKQICHEIMVFHGFHIPTFINLMPYIIKKLTQEEKEG